MKKYYFYWYGMKLYKAEGWMLLQEICDKVFGKGVVKVESKRDNCLTMHLRFVDGMKDFKGNLTYLLERMYMRMKDHHLEELVKQVALLADPEMWGQAYAKLVAWDLMWENYWNIGAIGLESFVAETLEDMPDNGCKPYTLALMNEDLVADAFKAGYEESFKDLVVLVRAPWNNSLFEDNEIKNYLYYRELARRTFEQEDEAVDLIHGILVIDQAQKDEVVCHTFRNSFCEEEDEELDDLLKELAKEHDGLYENFELKDC